MNIMMTGCSQGVGAYMRDRLKEQGHQVFGMGLEGPDFAFDVCETIDLGFTETLRSRMFNSAVAYFGGPVDCVVNNSGITHIDWTEDHGIEKFIEIMNVNLVLPFITSKGLIRQVQFETLSLRDTPKPRRIVNTSSLGTRLSLRTSTAYTASKCGLEGLTRTLAKEVAGRYPITVLAVAPGSIEGTAMSEQVIDGLMRTRGFTREQAVKYGDQNGRKASLEEVWKVFDFAINQAPDYMNGAVITMPNGLGVV